MHYWPRNYADVVDRASCVATISKAFGLCSCGFFDAVRAHLSIAVSQTACAQLPR